MPSLTASNRPPAAPNLRGVPRLRSHAVTPWVARLSAVCVWGVAGFVTAYGVLAWLGRSQPVALPAAPWVAPEIDSQAVARALGALPVVNDPVAPQPDASGRYTLMGVVAEGHASGAAHSRRQAGGVALIATDGQRARPYAVGAQLEGRWVVHAVTQRTVVLRPTGVQVPTGAAAYEGSVPGTITLAVPKP